MDLVHDFIISLVHKSIWPMYLLGQYSKSITSSSVEQLEPKLSIFYLI